MILRIIKTSLVCFLLLNTLPINAQNNVFSNIQKKYGIRVITDVSKMIPYHWQKAPLNGKATPLSLKLYKLAADQIDGALKEYPKRFLDKHLKGIAICDKLKFYNVAYGATAVYSTDVLIITVKKWSRLQWGIETIHHEFNHLLVNKKPFPRSTWASYNRPGFRYGNGGVEALINGKSSTLITDKALRRGFVNQYGESAIIEDIATMVEYALGNRSGFYSRALKYPIIVNKFNILKSYYYNLDPHFNDDFWSGKNTKEEYKIEKPEKEMSNVDPENTVAQKEEISVEANCPKNKKIWFYSYMNPQKYSNTFTNNNSTFIAYYIILNNPDKINRNVNINAYYYDPNAKLMGNFIRKYSSRGRSKIVCSHGFGWNKPGYWVKGKYKVKIYLENQFLVEGCFVIK